MLSWPHGYSLIFLRDKSPIFFVCLSLFNFFMLAFRYFFKIPYHIMTRLLILIFALNTLFSPVGAMAMVSFDVDNTISQTSKHTMSANNSEHCLSMSSHDTCNMDGSSSDLCKAKCVAACTLSPANIANFSFTFPFSISSSNPEIVFVHFYTRSISPELRPPLV